MNTKRKHYVMYYTMSYFRTSQKKPFLQLPFTVCTNDLFALRRCRHCSNAMSKLTINSFVNKKNTTGIYTEQYRLLDIINLVSLSSH